MVWTTRVRYYGGDFRDVEIPKRHSLIGETCEVFGLCAIGYGADILMEAMEKWLEQL